MGFSFRSLCTGFCPTGRLRFPLRTFFHARVSPENSVRLSHFLRADLNENSIVLAEAACGSRNSSPFIPFQSQNCRSRNRDPQHQLELDFTCSLTAYNRPADQRL